MSAELHPSIVALVSLAANIAANHPKQGLCQMDRLRHYGVSPDQIDAVVEIARHIRDETGEMMDFSFDEACREEGAKAKLSVIPVSEVACCTPTPGGKSCC